MQKIFYGKKGLLKCIILTLLLFQYSGGINALSLSFNKALTGKISNKWINAITLDKQGFLWLASGSKLWRFDGYKLKSYSYIFKSTTPNIKKLYVDQLDNLWIGTEKNGLFKFKKNNTSTLVEFNRYPRLINSKKITALMGDDKGNIWVGTDIGLSFISSNGHVINHPYLDQNKATTTIYITTLLNYSNNELLIGTNKHFLIFNKNNFTFEKVNLTNKKESFTIYSLYSDFEKNIWIASKRGLFRKGYNENAYSQFMPENIKGPITSVYVDNKNIWIGSFYHGLYKVTKKDKKVQNFLHDIKNQSSIAGDNVTSILGNNTNLWVNTYKKGLNHINVNTFDFGLEKLSNDSVYCADSEIFRNLISIDKSSIWITTKKGIIHYNIFDGHCVNYALDLNGNNTFKSKMIRFSILDSNNVLWIATTEGLNKFDLKSNSIDTTYERYVNKDIFFIYKLNHKLLIGTEKGLFEFDPSKKKSRKIFSDNKKLENSMFRTIISDKKNKLYIATNNGVALYENGEKLISYEKVQNFMPTKEILSLYLTKSDNLWVGTSGNGFFRFNSERVLVNVIEERDSSLKELSILSIIEDNNSNMWMGTDNGLLKYNESEKSMHLFHKNNGLQGEVFGHNAVFKTSDGKLYFGGNNGFNFYYPDDIKLSKKLPNIALTDFTRFGKSVEIGTKVDSFLLENDINYLEELELSYKDYVIGFEFAALDFKDTSRNKYAYMMEGLDPEWIYTDANNRSISYSNLSPGEYTFRVKASSKDGIWGNEGKSLKVIMNPAPWLSWWAYALYLILFYSLTSWYLKKKNTENHKITNLLKSEVARQTQELQTQKKKVEVLLARKNELFANVSHEFRTPLTLILGPINKLLNSHLPSSDIKALKMVNRNANRLLTMIEQMLQLAKVSGDENIKYYPTNTATRVKEIVESFMPLSQQKSIDLLLISNEDSQINCTKDMLEIVLGNLLSNAIKYTQIGGKIDVNSIIVNNEVRIQVTDTGCGLDDQQQQDIFNRFKRLDSHQNIEGIGIGLSVVKEIINANKAELIIKSKPGEGSTFTACFKIIQKSIEEPKHEGMNLLLTQLSNEVVGSKNSEDIQQIKNTQNKNSILIIDDNHDMCQHIESCLSDHYHCYLADGGKTGIALALKHVPDIIICDVMMPEMDGFHVSRVLRSDTRTSHIPLMLLTALDDKESRIRGWREHVDIYLTKPFDAQELLVQLENILVIRNILKQKAGKKIQAGECSNNIDLPKRDQQFIDKLNQLIAKKYQNSNYLRPQMASDMAVSERQLQRKLKALIGMNPMDLMREYRLKQAAIMLKNGYQVSISSDECGFNSVTYFSKCFKSQFGISPKVYQKTCK